MRVVLKSVGREIVGVSLLIVGGCLLAMGFLFLRHSLAIAGAMFAGIVAARIGSRLRRSDEARSVDAVNGLVTLAAETLLLIIATLFAVVVAVIWVQSRR